MCDPGGLPYKMTLLLRDGPTLLRGRCNDNCYMGPTWPYDMRMTEEKKSFMADNEEYEDMVWMRMRTIMIRMSVVIYSTHQFSSYSFVPLTVVM